MRIIVDIMSGDKAPLEILLGAHEAALDNPNVGFTFVGNEGIMRAIASAREFSLDLPNIEIVHTDGVITMEDQPLSVVREKKDSSMGIGLKLLADGQGDAFVSAGNTGALHAGSTLIVRRIKGTKTVAAAYELLENAEGVNFVGNIEGKDVPNGKCDVLVCDGFSGNIVLKLSEGLSKFIISKLTDVFTANPVTKVSYLGVKSGLKNMKKSFDASEYGGAPLLGLSKTVIKAHGNSDAYAIKNAIRQALSCVDNAVTYKIAKLVVPNIITEEKQ